MRMRRTALALAVAAAVTVPTVATASVAAAKPAAKPAASHGKPAAKPAKPTKPAKPAKPVKVTFSASGVVTAVDLDARTVTVAAKGGTKDVKGRTVGVVVPSTARIVLDDAPATVADLEAGFRITVTGTRLGTVYTASKVQASSPEPEVTPTPTPTPSEPSEPVEPPADEPAA